MTDQAPRPLPEQPAKRSERGRSVGRRLLRLLLIAALTLWTAAVATIIALTLALAAGWQSELVKTVIEASAGEAIGHDLRIRELEGSLFGGLTLHGVGLWPSDDAFDPGLRVERIEIDVELWRSLLQMGPVISRIVVDQPLLSLSRQPEGQWKLDGWGGIRPAPGAAPPAPGLAIVVDVLQIRDARLQVGLDVAARPLEAVGRFDAQLDGLRWQLGSPPRWPETGSLGAHIEALDWGGRPLGEGSMSWAVEGRKATLDTLALRGPLGQLDGSGELAFAGTPLAPALEAARTRTYFGGLDLSALGNGDGDGGATPGTALNGLFEAHLRWPDTSRHTSPRVAMTTTLAASEIAGQAVLGGQLIGELALEEQAWRLSPSSLELPAGALTLEGTGRADVIDGLRISAELIDLAALFEAGRRERSVEGRATVDIRLAGPLRDPTGTLVLSCTELRSGDLGPAELSLEISAPGDRRLTIDSFAVEVAGDAPRLAGASLRSTGPASLELAPGSVAVRDLELTWPAGALAISGGFAGESLLPTRVELAGVDVAVAARLLRTDWPVSGELSGSLDLSGALARPDVVGRMQWHRPRYAELEADAVGLDVDWMGEAVTVAADVFEASREQLRVEARLPRNLDWADPRAALTDERTRVEVRATQFDLAWLTPLLERRKLEVEGFVDGTLSAAGGAPRPRIDGALNVRDGRLMPLEAGGRREAALLAGPVDGRISFAGSTISVVGMRVGEGARELALDSRVSWSGPQAEKVDFVARLTGIGFHGWVTAFGGLSGDRLEHTRIELADFEAAELGRIPEHELDLGGQLSAAIELEGPVTSPDFELSGDWEAPRIADASAEALQLDVRRAGAQIEAAARLVRGDRVELLADARLPLPASSDVSSLPEIARGWMRDPEAHLQIRADDFSLRWLPALGRGGRLDAGGAVDGEVLVTGGEPLPRTQGDLSLRGVTFSLAGQRTSLGPLNGDVRLSGAQASFQRLELASRKGRAEISGRVGWSPAGIDDVTLQIFFEHYLFNQLGLLRTYLDGNIVTSGPLDALDVAGAIQLSDVRVSFPSPQDPVMKEIRVMGLPEASDSASIYEGEGQIAGVDTNTRMDVSFVMPPGTWVRGMGLDAEIIGELRITKQRGEGPRYLGEFQVEHGRYTLQGKRFQLERGVAIFGDVEEPIPEVDIQATRQAAQSVFVTAHLTGPANQPQLELTSVPPMDSAEIISFLYFGGAAQPGTGDASEELGTTAAAVVGAMLMENVSPEIRETLRIDQISVTSGEEGEPPAVEIETQITPDVYLRLKQSLGATAQESAEVRWRFFRDFNLRSEVHRSGESSIDLLWAYDYWGLDRFGLRGLKSAPPPYRREPESAEGEAGASTDAAAPAEPAEPTAQPESPNPRE